MLTELQRAREIIREKKFPVIIELGAHHGNDTVVLHDSCIVHPDPYIAVEADPRNIGMLVNRIQRRRVWVTWAAIADHCGTVNLHLCNGNGTGSSSIRQPKEHLKHFPSITFGSSVEVPALTLDALSMDYGARREIDLIWADLQGAEKDMILGGRETLKRTRYLLCECDAVEMYEGQASKDELLSLLPGWELACEWPANANLLLRNTNPQ